MCLLSLEIDRTGLKFAGEDFDEGEGFSKKLIPAGDLAEAGFLEVGGGRGGINTGLEDAEAAGAVFEVGVDAVAEVAAGELAQTFARGAAAELQAHLHVVKREGFLRAEKEAVNLTDGARQRQCPEDVDKKCD